MFFQSVQSEWLKTRRSAASWLCIAGGAFLPLMFLIGNLINHRYLAAVPGAPNAWTMYATQLWQFMGIFLLPFGIVLAASLMTQIEFRNNTWKQLHTTPQGYTTIFSAKLSVILLMVAKFFIFFNAGLLLSAVIPALVFSGRLPADDLPAAFLLRLNGRFFLCCLPIVALQYLLSLLFRNFLVPVGIGLLLVIGSLILIETWKYAWVSPYSYTQLMVIGAKKAPASVSVYRLSAAYAGVFTLAAYVLYRLKKSKG